MFFMGDNIEVIVHAYPFDCRTYIGFDVRELIWSQTERMTIEEFFKRFPEEASCIQHVSALEEANGLSCLACYSKRMSWLSTCARWGVLGL